MGRGEYDPDTGLWDWYEREGEPLGVVVGRNVKRIREARGLTQHELSQSWQRNGLSWARSKLAALESGTRPRVDAGELVLMAISLQVQVWGLFEGDDDSSLVSLDSHDKARVSRAELRELFRGQLASVALDLAIDQAGAADIDLAKRLGVEPRVIAEMAATMFDGRNLTQERDRRVARLGDLTVGQRQAHRGHITRELSKQIEAALPSPKRGNRG
jgi:transcriptional regulator with XRE-family HTH domain